jgi:hypothetical protein
VAQPLNPAAPLREHRERGTLREHDPLTPTVLRRVQLGVIASRFTREDVRAAIANSLA